jgi:hypothetical protein
VYYLDSSYIVQEYCYSLGKGWYQGQISQVGAKAAPSAGLTASIYIDQNGGIQIHVFYQGEYRLFQYAIDLLKCLEEDGTTRTVKELIHYGGQDDIWSAGDLALEGSLADTNLSAVTYLNINEKIQTCLYYQARDLSLKDHVYIEGWGPGQFISPAQSHCN